MSTFTVGDKVFYPFYRNKYFKGIGTVKGENKDYIKVSFGDNYDNIEFTKDGKLMKNLNVLLFNSEEEFDKIERFYYNTPIDISVDETDKMKIFEALIKARDFYNEGWTPKWDRVSESKSVLTVKSNEIDIEYSWINLRTFYFKYYEIAQQFLYNYRLFLTQIKDFI
jgi:hypothetical protein